MEICGEGNRAAERDVQNRIHFRPHLLPECPDQTGSPTDAQRHPRLYLQVFIKEEKIISAPTLLKFPPEKKVSPHGKKYFSPEQKWSFARTAGVSAISPDKSLWNHSLFFRKKTHSLTKCGKERWWQKTSG